MEVGIYLHDAGLALSGGRSSARDEESTYIVHEDKRYGQFVYAGVDTTGDPL